MHHVTLDTWSRLSSPLHRLDARAKIVAAAAILLSLVVTERSYAVLLPAYGVLITAAALVGRLPPAGLLARAALVLPFVGSVAALNLWGGDATRAASVVGKSFLSASTVLVLLGTTPLHALLRGLESLGAPRFFLMVAQFLYRYLFVLSEQAQHMLQARRCRAPLPHRGSLAGSAAGVVAVLFARSYGRAERIHQAMLARGFRGHFVLLAPTALGRRDFVFLAATAAALGSIHLLLWNL